jgi:enolase
MQAHRRFVIVIGLQYDGNVISGEELGNLYQSLAADFPIVTIEDPFDEDDWKNWSKYVVGPRLF